VTATGARSEIGKIGQSLRRLETEAPRLRAETGRLVRVFALLGGAVAVLAVVLQGMLRGGWLDGLLAGIALGMSMMPEEFPLVLTVFMAMGAWRISKARVLARRAAAIETLGSATVLCTDKTGTLTENRMAIAELRLPDGARHVVVPISRRSSSNCSTSAFWPAPRRRPIRWKSPSEISARRSGRPRRPSRAASCGNTVCAPTSSR
jgi:Ca2+-transporting ATPase